MRLYEVIPIAKGIGKETLSYFGNDSIEVGSLVNIPLRKKTSPALVINSKNIDEEKTEIKSAGFALKKISSVKSKSIISKHFLEAAEKTSEYFATTTGAMLSIVLPELILSSPLEKIKIKEKNATIKREPLVLQADDKERFAHYRGFIRGEFAKKASVYVCLPTIEDIEWAKIELQKGIEQYVVTLHSSLSKKEFKKQIEIIENENHPILIIGTVPFLSAERNDLESIILEKENSRGYRTQRRPFVDLRIFVKKFAEKSKKKLILGDLLLSTETLWKQKEDEYTEFTPIKTRLLSSAQTLLIDMKNKKGEFEEKFRVLSPELEALIDRTKEENERLLIFASRKGLAPTTVCGDCGQIVVCKNCGAPVIVYSRSGKNIFKCNKCGIERDATEKCSNCDSWKLTMLGIGIERIEDEIKKKFPKVEIFRIDKEKIKTAKKAQGVIAKFLNTPGSVLLGTELALYYLKSEVENVAVASMDSMFALPDFRINEKIFYILLTLRAKAERVFIIQTRNANENIFDYALKGNISDFYREEIEDRKKFSYPPFSLFIKLSIEGRRPSVQNEANKLAELFKKWEPLISQSLSPSKRGNTIMNIILKLTSIEWPEKEILRTIANLPLNVSIRVDPESLL